MRATQKRFSTLFLIALLFTALLVCSCGSSDNKPVNSDNDAEAEAEVETNPLVDCLDAAGCYEATYRLNGKMTTANNDGDVNLIPFPYNYFAKIDDATITGLRVNLAYALNEYFVTTNSRIIDTGLSFMNNKNYVDTLNTLDGFSAVGYIMFETGEKIAESSFPSNKTDTANKLISPVLIINADKSSSDFGKAAAYTPLVKEAFNFIEGSDATEHLYWYLALRPDKPLAYKTKYAVVVTKKLKSESGKSPIISNHFAQVWGIKPVDSTGMGSTERAAEKERLASLKELLKDVEGINLDEVVLAFDFTTQSAADDLEYLAGEYLDNAAIEPPDLDFDKDNAINFYKISDYPKTLPSLPSVDANFVDYVVVGEMKTPDFRQDQDDRNSPYYYHFKRGADKKPTMYGYTYNQFFLFYPKNAQKPMPIAIIQHGISNRKEGMRGLVGPLAEKGIASIIFDFPFHGHRSVGYAPLEFIDIVHPGKAVSNFKQAAFEHNWYMRAFASGKFDFYPDGKGTGESDFDKTKIGYFGHSLGSIVGETSVSISKDAAIAHFCAGGAGLIDFVSDFLATYGMADLYPDYYITQFMTVAQTFLDGGDPINYVQKINSKRAENKFRFMFTQAMEDETIMLPFYLNFAYLIDITQVEPVAKPYFDKPTAPAPYTGGNGWFQYPGANHDFTFSGPFEDKAKKQFSEFFGSYFFDGSGKATVINPL